MRKFRIGLITNEPAPTAGGAHGFVNSILSVLLKENIEEDFDLLFINEIDNLKTSTSQSFFKQYAFERNSNFENVYLKLNAFLPRVSRRINKYLGIEKAIKDLHLDFVFFLGSGFVCLFSGLLWLVCFFLFL